MHKTNLIIVTILLIISSVFAGETPIDKPAYDSQEYPIPFVLSIVGSNNPHLNPYLDQTTTFHLSLFSGRIHSVQGLQLGAISNHVTSNFVGYDAAGIYSEVGGNFAGYQTTGISSVVYGNFIGLQHTGIYSRVASNFFGLQTSGILNKVDGNFTGMQISGIVNEAQNVRYLQVAGITNKAANVEGVQIAGIVNNADHVKGIQIGLINHSKKLDGIAIGLINTSESGKVHLVAWGSTPEEINVGLKFAPNNYWYTMLSLGNRGGFDEQEVLPVFQSRMGVHMDLVQRLYVEFDLGGGGSLPNGFSALDDGDSYQNMIEARFSLGYKIGSRIAVFGGISQSRIGSEIDWFDGEQGESMPFFGIQL